VDVPHVPKQKLGTEACDKDRAQSYSPVIPLRGVTGGWVADVLILFEPDSFRIALRYMEESGFFIVLERTEIFKMTEKGIKDT